MQTLGAKNAFVRNQRGRGTLDAVKPNKGAKESQQQQQQSDEHFAMHNPAFEDEYGGDKNMINMTNMYGGQAGPQPPVHPPRRARPNHDISPV